MKHLTIIIRGQVQRVGFRFRTMEAAYKYGVTGIVMNQDDNSVYVEAEGEEKPMQQFLAWCHTGPLGAKVATVEVEEGPLQHFTSFEIRSRKKWQSSEKE